ncbi:protein of unknown function [Taphrina deformans PYCC 5710]|uniref:Extracellular membrane protein CFEM domain-containing protein n=1 Tax=Taphrina deformans (strain PYCC 5710 / ATCC 11124 / CBS 356.35 / IMI 108563 / JCM 9778 / NBRC 8474) TaxID=1097556 RepID=R4XBG7_TAPDE|nr:protein of unknown function [Taphrina deformans PYCC 5710]|eukprot:CCG82940.1 protein of unknown function [Taphrina deformans PYCC 5710]
MKFTLLFAALLSVSQAARLTLNDGYLMAAMPKCGVECLQELDCSTNTIVSIHLGRRVCIGSPIQDSFTFCLETKCSRHDPTVASAIEKYMATCHVSDPENMDAAAVDHLKDLYMSSQMALLKRQAAAVANSTSTNGTNSSSNSTSNSTSTTTTSGTTTQQSGTHASGCSSIGDVLNGVCIVRSSDANHNARNTVLLLAGSVLFVAYLF